MKKYARIVLVALMAAAAFGRPLVAKATTVDIYLSLTKFAKVAHLDAGASVGVSPSKAVVHVGDTIVFVNADADGRHTATSLAASAKFIDSPKWTDAVLKPSGAIGDGAWSTGELAPGAKSQALRADRPGEFLYGCFFDYGAGMRGEIIVEP